MNTQTNDIKSIRGKPRSRALGCLIIVSILAVGCSFLFQAITDAREAARQSGCRGRFGQLHLAFLNYHAVYGSFPPAYVADGDGTPMHSWRVLILPFINQKAVYEEYDFSEPWNGPHNRTLSQQIYNDIFHCPSSPHSEASPMTDYVVITGPDTAFPGDVSTSSDDNRDGLKNTILVVEIANSNIHWMEPRDLDTETMSFTVDDPVLPSISSHHPTGPGVVFPDRGSAFRLDASLQTRTLKALTTIAGNEPVSRDDLTFYKENGGNAVAE